MKKMTKIVMLVAILALAAGAALAEEKVTDPKKMDGKDLYKTQCKVCHGEDSDAGEYTPMSYIMEQWEEFFDDLWVETHAEVPSLDQEDKMVPDTLDKDMMKKIKRFCVDHAADSEMPMTCG